MQVAAISISRKQSISSRFVALMFVVASFGLGLGGGYALANHGSLASNAHATPVLQVVYGPQSDLTRVLPSVTPVGGPDSDLTRVLPSASPVGGPDSDLTRVLPR